MAPKPKTIAFIPSNIEMLEKGRPIEWAETVVRFIPQEESQLKAAGGKHHIGVGTVDLSKIIDGGTVEIGTCKLCLDESQFGPIGSSAGLRQGIVADVQKRVGEPDPQEPEKGTI